MQKIKSDITKSILANSLKKLLLYKPLNKISIKELVADSGLNRQTFYYHFEDIYALVEWGFKKELLSSFKNYEGEKLWQEGLREFLNYIDENRIVCQNTLVPLSHGMMSKLFYHDISSLIVRAIDDIVGDYPVDKNYIARITQYFTISFGSFIEQWTFNQVNQTVDELVDFLDRIIQDQIAGNRLRM